MPNEIELLPCPFCGNDGTGPIEDALHVFHSEHDWRDESDSYTVQCDKCTATMGYSDTEDDAIAAWNRRAALSRTVEAEPVAWRYKDENSGIWHYVEGYEPVRREERQALFANPPDQSQEIERLRELFKTQSESHARHVKGLIAQHEAEREIYGKAAQDFRERAEAAEARTVEGEPVDDDRIPIAATDLRDVDYVDVTGWGVFKGHAIPVDVARFIAEKINFYHAYRATPPDQSSEVEKLRREVETQAKLYRQALARAKAAESRLASQERAPVVTEGIEEYYARQIEWSRKTFGPGERSRGIVDHIRKELHEIEADPFDLSEWIDVMILAMDGYWRHGGTPESLMAGLLAKQKKNFARAWPDWRTMSADQAIEHVRTGEAL